MTRILISGPPASGKTTLANDIAQRIGGEVIDFDAIAESFGSPGHDHSRDVAQRAHAEVDRRIRETAGPAVLIRSTPRAADRESVARAFRADATFVLTLPAEAAKERASQDSRPSWTAEAIDHWWSTFEPSEMDTSRSAMLTGEQLIGHAAMADAPEIPPVPAAEPAQASVPPIDPPEPKPLGENGEKALKAERDARRAAEKERADLAARLKEFEDRDKSEAERQADRLANLTKERDDLAAEKARYEAALTHGLSKDDLALLGSGSAEDIAERAALLAQRLGNRPPEPAPRLPESPNAGRDAQLSDADAEYEAFASQYFNPNKR